MKKAVVVGASSGIGREVARLLLQQGWSVGLAARREEPLHALAHDYPDRAWVQAIDVTRDDAPQALMALIGQMGGIDLYFHAAGVGWQKRCPRCHQGDAHAPHQWGGVHANGG